LKARIVETEEISIATQSRKHVLAATNMNATIEKLLETVFSMQSMLKLYEEEFARVKLGERKIWVMGPVRSKTKNGCAGRASRKLPDQTRPESKSVSQRLTQSCDSTS
jgi:hypothetical protein